MASARPWTTREAGGRTLAGLGLVGSLQVSGGHGGGTPYITFSPTPTHPTPRSFASPSKKAQRLRHGGPGKDTSGAAGVAWLTANAAAGVLSLAHIGDVDQGVDYKYALACFLAGANNRSFFAFSSADKTEPAWEECWDGGSPTAPVFPTWCSGQGWSDDYARPLGEPTGPATATGGAKEEVQRSFASGTRVTVELTGSSCTIAWSDGHTTVCG